jgi:hypothetical protein
MNESTPIRNDMHVQDQARQWVIASHTTPRGILRETHLALEALGYCLVAHANTEGQALDDNALECDLRLVDEREVGLIPTPAEDPDTPIVTLTGPRPKSFEDPRVVGSIRRPARLLDVYHLLQEALEKTPRSSPRVTTQLPARCIRSDRRWPGAVLSLSTNGCLLRSQTDIERGMQINLQFALPRGGVITIRAQCVYLVGNDAGLVFRSTSEEDLETITDYVIDQLIDR